MLTDAMLILLIGTVTVLLPLSKAYRSRLRRRLVKLARATVPPEQSKALETRVTRQSLMTGAAILVAGLVVLALDRLWEVAGANFILVTFLAGAAGHALADILWPNTAGPGPRTARATATTAAHYVPTSFRVTAWATLGTGLVAVVGTLLLARTEFFDRNTILSSSVPAYAVGLVLVVLLVQWATHRVLRAPQPARDQVELYWQDALRAQTLSRLGTIPPVLGTLACLSSSNALWSAAWATSPPGGPPPPTWALWSCIGLAALPFAVVLAGAVVTAARRDAWNEFQHVRRALWDGVAPDPRTQEVDA